MGTRTGDRYQQSLRDGALPKDVFPDNWSEARIEQAIRQAFHNRETAVQRGGNRWRVTGQDNAGNVLEMWYHPETQTIETAYPKSLIDWWN